MGYYLPLNAKKMTDVILSLLNLHVYDVYDPQTFQRLFPLRARI